MKTKTWIISLLPSGSIRVSSDGAVREFCNSVGLAEAFATVSCELEAVIGQLSEVRKVVGSSQQDLSKLRDQICQALEIDVPF